MEFNLNALEYFCYRREHEKAAAELHRLLRIIDENYGFLRGLDPWSQSVEAFPILEDHLSVRLTSAISSLVTDPDFRLSDDGFAQLAQMQRWLAALFSVSPFRNADHILRSFGVDQMARTDLDVPYDTMAKFSLFYFPDSEVSVDWDILWNFDRKTAARLAFMLMSPRFLGTQAAHQKRELLLRWLPERLAQLDTLDDLPVGVLHDVYMYCSYADLPQKHAIKKPINELIRRKLKRLDLLDIERPASTPARGKKPVAVVILEWFSKNHSIYRTHSLTMTRLRDHFHVIGVGYEQAVDDFGRAVFDEFISIGAGDVWDHARHIRDICEANDAQIAYMPSVGMFPITMVMACLRVAPLQVMALGHPATTHSETIDYVVVEEDYVGDERCFSEKLLKLPADGMPYRPPEAMRALELKPLARTKQVVRIAVASASMKLNPRFLEMCARIVREVSVPVEFHFLVGQAIGVVNHQVRHSIHRILGDHAVTHGQQKYDEYMNVIAGCDLFMNPYPFGNTNGIVDTVWAGLVGVCKTGPEVHEHIDEGMFRRLGFPEWMIAKTEDDYFAAVKRLVENGDERAALAARLTGPAAVEKLVFEGRPEILAEKLKGIWKKLCADDKKAPQSRAKRAKAPKPEALPIPDWLQREVDDYFAERLDVTPATILDIGANIGAFALRAHREWPAARLLCYEPMPFNIEQLNHNVNTEWCEVVPCAVRAQAGDDHIYVGDSFVTGGFVKGARQTGNSIRVTCVAAADLPSSELVKIDTEGSEVEILQNLDISKTQVILLEHHSKHDAAAIKQMLATEFRIVHDESDREVGTMIFRRHDAATSPRARHDT
ncbi:FkbM family methyltransferase [Burkholderia cepacia]|uniref:FkbM family methyltransferase n=1 Tax=Burkholderia cepacia TaxID=292 RepID=UPI0013F47219|nr:FkbM family methyltransferase [Burkholderia cepacia]NHB06596.1 FkbM family methyltransferase [Burkholderia cepacia]